MHAKPHHNEQIQNEAVEWFIRFCEDEADAAACAAFNAWLRASPQHVQAYIDISAFWEAAGSLAKPSAQDIDRLVERARLESNVIEMRPGGTDAANKAVNEAANKAPNEPPAHQPRRRGFWLAACAAAVALAAGALVWQSTRYPTYVTGAGERRSITLEDGSTVDLNARSRIQLRYTRAERDIDLLEGQAFFRVAKNPERPFIVHSGTGHVRAVGTEFDVYRKPDATVVTVIEGRVSVSGSPPAPEMGAVPSAPASDRVLLSAGEQVTMTAKTAPVPHRADVATATAWTTGRLVFYSSPLTDVIAEFNRYSKRPLTLDDPAVERFHVTGSFATADPGQLVNFLVQRFDLAVEEHPDGIHLVHGKR